MGFWLGEGTDKEHFGNPDLKYIIPEIAMEDLEDWLFSEFDQYKYVGFVVDESWSCKHTYSSVVRLGFVFFP